MTDFCFLYKEYEKMSVMSVMCFFTGKRTHVKEKQTGKA